MKDILFFTYGSIMEGEYNFNRFGKQEVLAKNVRIHDKFILCNYANYYPKLIECPKNMTPTGVTGEIHKLSKKEYNMLKDMEVREGYTESTIECKDLEFDEANAEVMKTLAEATIHVFIWTKDKLIIRSGDWKDNTDRQMPRK